MGAVGQYHEHVYIDKHLCDYEMSTDNSFHL
jgi:hypothetical protein